MNTLRHILACLALLCFLVPFGASAQDTSEAVCGCPEGQRTCAGKCCPEGQVCCGKALGCQKSCKKSEPKTAAPVGGGGGSSVPGGGSGGKEKPGSSPTPQ